MSKETVQAADCETHCQCCGRKNRKLFLVQGGWVGHDCAKRLEVYRDLIQCGNDPAKSAYFHGYERQLQQVVSFCERVA